MSRHPRIPDLPPLRPGESRTIIVSAPAPEDVEYHFGVERQDGVLVGTLNIEDRETGEQVSKLSMAAADLIPELEVWLRDLKLLSAEPGLAIPLDREKA